MTTKPELTAAQLAAGGVQEETWTIGRARHLVRLSLFRTKPAPPLYRVFHRIFHMPAEGPPVPEERAFLYDTLPAARAKYQGVRASPPATYDTTD